MRRSRLHPLLRLVFECLSVALLVGSCLAIPWARNDLAPLFLLTCENRV